MEKIRLTMKDLSCCFTDRYGEKYGIDEHGRIYQVITDSLGRGRVGAQVIRATTIDRLNADHNSICKCGKYYGI